MNPYRAILVAVLTLLPFGGLVIAGGFLLWERGWWIWAWWPMAACWGVSSFLAWRWARSRKLLPAVEPEIARHWTQRDKDALKLVVAKADEADKLNRDQLADPTIYRQVAEQIAFDIAKHYHPKASDLYGDLTVVEMLAVAELLAQDLAKAVETYVPGSHMLTINDWKKARKLLDWYSTGVQAYWAVAAIFNPIEVAMRYAATQATTGAAMAGLQVNVQQWFYRLYVERLGHYLIELHSGRLRAGAARYRAFLAGLEPVPTPAETPPHPSAPASETVPSRKVTIGIIGQVKAGKSSLVNALFGAEMARADVVPRTNAITAYRLALGNGATELTLLDTVGYGHAGPTADQLSSTETAAREADALLLVFHATNPGRQADVTLLTRLQEWFAAHPQYKLPPIIGVVTHGDLLAPSLEWTPPYNWRQPTRKKEHSLAAAVETVREQLGSHLAAIVPVRAEAGKEWNLAEELLPAILAQLDDAHAVGLLRGLMVDANTGRYAKVIEQVKAGGLQVLREVWANLSKK